MKKYTMVVIKTNQFFPDSPIKVQYSHKNNGFCIVKNPYFPTFSIVCNHKIVCSFFDFRDAKMFLRKLISFLMKKSITSRQFMNFSITEEMAVFREIFKLFKTRGFHFP